MKIPRNLRGISHCRVYYRRIRVSTYVRLPCKDDSLPSPFPNPYEAGAHLCAPCAMDGLRFMFCFIVLFHNSSVSMFSSFLSKRSMYISLSELVHPDPPFLLSMKL